MAHSRHEDEGCPLQAGRHALPNPGRNPDISGAPQHERRLRDGIEPSLEGAEIELAGQSVVTDRVHRRDEDVVAAGDTEDEAEGSMLWRLIRGWTSSQRQDRRRNRL